MGILPILTEPEKIIAHIDNRAETLSIELRLKEFFSKKRTESALVLCIGTDRSTGDALGPLTGTFLSRYHLPQLTVVGTLDQPVHAVNLHETLDRIENDYQYSFVLAIDACLGRLNSIGYITLAKGPLKPGAGVHKELPWIGDAHLTGTVNTSGFMEYMVLQSTRLNLVWHMSETMAMLIARAYRGSIITK